MLIFAIVYLMQLMVGSPKLWNLEQGTMQDPMDPELTVSINGRTKNRGTVASCLQSLSFSLVVNALLDKRGRVQYAFCEAQVHQPPAMLSHRFLAPTGTGRSTPPPPQSSLA